MKIPSMQSILSILPKIVPKKFYPTLRSLLILTLKIGPLPNHVGFIMDGNRRFSRSNGVSIEQGHLAGFEALKRVLELLLRLEIPNVTVYAFAIENFNRSAEEVSKLMNLARVKLVEICEKGQLLDRYGIRVVVIGRKDLLPPDVQDSVNKVEAMTANNSRGCLNVAFPYSSQEEMATAMCQTIKESIINKTPTNQISIETINNHTYTSHCPPLDVLIRTSGVQRLSDFLLWQTSRSIKPRSKNNHSQNSSQYPRDKVDEEGDGGEGFDGNSVEENDERSFDDENDEDRGLKFLKDLGPSVHFVPRFWPDFGILDVLPILLGWQAEKIFQHLF